MYREDDLDELEMIATGQPQLVEEKADRSKSKKKKDRRRKDDDW